MKGTIKRGTIAIASSTFEIKTDNNNPYEDPYQNPKIPIPQHTQNYPLSF